MDVTKPYKFIRFGAMDVTKPYKSIRFGAMDVTKPYKFIGFGAMDVTKPYEFIGFGHFGPVSLRWSRPGTVPMPGAGRAAAPRRR